MNKLEKILLLIGLVLLSILLRTIFEPSFLGIYLDKLSLYLLALVLGLKFTILGAVLIVICYALVLNDIIGIFRLPTYFLFAIMVGGLMEIVTRRRDIGSGIIEFSWFLTLVFSGIVVSMLLTGLISVITLIVFIAIGFIFVISYWGKFPRLSIFLRNSYAIIALYALTPLTYTLLEFSFYGAIAYNFLSPTNIVYSNVPNAVLSYGGDALVSMLLIVLIYLSWGRIRDTDAMKRISGRKLLSLSIMVLVLLALLVPSVTWYNNREKALLPSLPENVSPWALTVVKMDYVWLPIGAHGTNYYYLVPGGRENSSSQYYQAWFGIYWINGKWYSEEDIALVKDYIYKFAVVDQNFWLSTHGDPEPYTAVKEEEQFVRYTVNGVEGWLMIGSMYTHSDVAAEGYREISIKGFFFVVYFVKYDKTAIVYACTYEPYYDTNLNGIRDELFAMLHKISWPE